VKWEEGEKGRRRIGESKGEGREGVERRKEEVGGKEEGEGR
jgi:hypothetical protein